MKDDQSIEQDLQAIDELHRKDMIASKAGDHATLRSIMSDDAVVMPPGGKWLRGKEELDKSFSRMKDGMSEVEVLEYILDFEEVKVLGEYAFEWGTIRGSMRASPDGDVEHQTYKVMRILKKQHGEWKVHRTIWNANPVE